MHHSYFFLKRPIHIAIAKHVPPAPRIVTKTDTPTVAPMVTETSAGGKGMALIIGITVVDYIVHCPYVYCTD